MNTPAREFFKAGGTLPPDAPSYIERQADRELFERVLAGDFCYVLTTRQMGKSSLMARTAKRLREQGVQTAIVDLTQIGTEKDKQSADQWYYGISHKILRELGLNVKLQDWWNERQNLPALQRLTEFFSDLVLANTTGRVVIFVDEIDSTISLPFTDDFFAAIRACFNARATAPAYQRLSFVLLGVASPSDLMKDPQRTPFNIGQRIDLTDFTFDEARPLAKGLGMNSRDAEQILQRVLYWTNGHPYLTQKLCRALLEENLNNGAEADIDRLVDKHFLAPEANRQEYNLNFVRDRLTGDRRRSRPLLKVYRRIYQKQRVVDNPLSPVHTVLKLSGLVVPREERALIVRNRIYERVFTAAWAKRVMPEDWNRRIAFASFITVVLLGFSIWYTLNIQALTKTNEYNPTAKDAHANLHRIPGFGGLADELLAQFWERQARLFEYAGNRDQALLGRLRALEAKVTETRRSEVSRLVGEDYNRLFATYRHENSVFAVAFSPDGDKVLTGSRDGTARLWSAASGATLGEPILHKNSVLAVAFSPDGERVLTGSSDGTAQLWSTASGMALGEPMRHGDRVYAVAFGPDGERVLTGSSDGTAQLWSTASGMALGVPMRHENSVKAVAFSPDGMKVLTGSEDRTARLWSATTGAALGAPMRHENFVIAVLFSPDGEKVWTCTEDGEARLWSAAGGAALGEPIRHLTKYAVVAFSPDGERMLTASRDIFERDWTGRLWSAKTGAALGVPMRHEGAVHAVAFSPDGDKVLTGGWDSTARLWSVKTSEALNDVIRLESTINEAALSPDGDKVLTGSRDGTTRLWSAASGAALGEPIRHKNSVSAVAFSPDGERVLTGSSDGTAQLWTASGAALGAPMRHGTIIYALAFSPDGEKVLTCTEDGEARLWSAASAAALGEPMRYRAIGGMERIFAVAFSPDGERVLTGSRHGTVRLWSVKTGAALGELMQHQGVVTAVAFSPDGEKVLTGSYDQTARLWSAASGAALGEPMRHEDRVNTVAFSPDGQAVMAATTSWVHLSTIAGDSLTPVPKASRMLSGGWLGAYRFLDEAGNQMQVAVRTTINTVKIDTLRVDIPNAPPLSGVPKTLLEEWQRKLALQFDENGKIVPRYPVAVAQPTRDEREKLLLPQE